MNRYLLSVTLAHEEILHTSPQFRVANYREQRRELLIAQIAVSRESTCTTVPEIPAAEIDRGKRIVGSRRLLKIVRIMSESGAVGARGRRVVKFSFGEKKVRVRERVECAGAPSTSAFFSI